MLRTVDGSTEAEVKRQGAYLTDRLRLYRVVDSQGDHVALENCRCPEENPRWVKVSVVLRQMRVVRPDVSRS